MFQNNLADGKKVKNNSFPPEFGKPWFAEASNFKSGNPLAL